MKVLRSIKVRLTFWYLMVIIGLLFVFSVVAYLLLSRNLYQNFDSGLKMTATQLEASITLTDDAVFAGQPNEVLMIYSQSGTLLRQFGPSVAASDVKGILNQAMAGNSTFSTVPATKDDKTTMRLYAMPFSTSFNNNLIVIIGRPTDDIDRILTTFRQILAICGIGAVLVAGAGGFFLANKALKPVDRITMTAREIGENDLSRRVTVHGEDELGRLASTLNSMIERLQVAFERQKQFAADASHELRTPLAVMQAETSLALGKNRTKADFQNSLEVVSQEINYMSSIIGDLLFLARSDSGREPVSIENVNIKELFAEVSSDMSTLASDKGLTFEIGPLDNVTVRGDSVKLRQLFVNILGNAIRYTPDGGTVSGSIVRQDDGALITISDTGIGISPEHLPHIFERFYRVDKARSREAGGTGLGLAIASQITEIHHGKIEVDSTPEKGTTFRIFLPIEDENSSESLTQHPAVLRPNRADIQ